MTTIVTRAAKGAALSHADMDANFNNLNNDKIEIGTIQPLIDAVIPVGSMAIFAAGVPAKWLECNGQSLARAGTYAALFAYLDVAYDSVDSSHFNLPDYRGYMLRHVDGGQGIDPDALGRSDRGDGLGGDIVGSRQQDEFKSHTHTETRLGHISKKDYQPGQHLNAFGNTSQTTGATGGLETRPKNIGVLICIRAE